ILDHRLEQPVARLGCFAEPADRSCSRESAVEPALCPNTVRVTTASAEPLYGSDDPAVRPDRLTLRPAWLALRADRADARSTELGRPARIVWEPCAGPSSSVDLTTSWPRVPWGRHVPDESLAAEA